MSSDLWAALFRFNNDGGLEGGSSFLCYCFIFKLQTSFDRLSEYFWGIYQVQVDKPTTQKKRRTLNAIVTNRSLSEWGVWTHSTINHREKNIYPQPNIVTLKTESYIHIVRAKRSLIPGERFAPRNREPHYRCKMRSLSKRSNTQIGRSMIHTINNARQSNKQL